ncbi:hypothetical protein NQ314_009995 [Rhamnusium bicolor]|uniref:tRNA-splicing endonuclease subunit Sen15 domain-containing protein n=1 Tax=Rhamnusium bicolor TaxID=1586634 RepID=A0AAV8XVU4_9CUCU|nr:hypothetical protein NQ314_009995 [Rhamnusium bicolor]
MDEKLISEFMKTVNRKEAVITLQVYLELCEIKRYYDIKYSFTPTLNKISLTAKKFKDGPACVFLPITTNEDLNFLKMQNFLRSISQETLFLVIVHADSTCVYYQLANSLLEPTDMTAKHLRENKQEKLDNNLKKNQELLEQAALFGLRVTLKKDVKDETVENDR